MMKVMLVTGGAGFIGSNFIKYFLRRNKNYIIADIDKLAYSSNLENIKDLEDSPRHHFIKGDICNAELVDYVLRKYRPSAIINFAGESDTDRSVNHPSAFANTNIMGTITLLESARFIWGRTGMKGNRFIQVSTDAVYGTENTGKGYFTEESPLLPDNPYSASKAGADLLVRAFSKTYGIPAIITRSCSVYGPYQHIEKFIPQCITNGLQDRPIPLFGDGSNTREWIHVNDHSVGIIRALFYGYPGEIYNIGSGDRISNADLARKVLHLLDKPEDRLDCGKERPVHDKCHSLNSYKSTSNLNWNTKYNLDDGLRETIRWYMDNPDYWKT